MACEPGKLKASITAPAPPSGVFPAGFASPERGGGFFFRFNMKNPAVKFYPDNFLGATSLWENNQVGAYIRILSQQIIFGHLSEKQILKIIESKELWEFLKPKFVLDDNGLYYNLRMDHEINRAQGQSDKNAENAKKRWNPDANADANADANLTSEYEYCIPVSWSIELRGVWGEWVQHRKEKKIKLTKKAIEKQIKFLNEIGEDRAIAAINYSIRQGWTGIFEEKKQHPGFGPKPLTKEGLRAQARALGITDG